MRVVLVHLLVVLLQVQVRQVVPLVIVSQAVLLLVLPALHLVVQRLQALVVQVAPVVLLPVLPALPVLR